VLADILWGLLMSILSPALEPDDFRRDGPPVSSPWLRRRNRWSVVLRQLDRAEPTGRPLGLSRRWHRFVLEVVPGRSQVRYRRRRRWVWHTAPAPVIRRSDVRLPGRHEISKFRQVFPVNWAGTACEVGIWSREVRPLKADLDAAASK
jgi:hypothetical protein